MDDMKSVRLEIKTLTDAGEFTGLASPYGNEDNGHDIVEPGAFTKTIAERGDKVRLLDGHGVRIGIARVWDTAEGLAAAGKINLDKQAGRDAYSDLKFYEEQGLPMGMSIGFKTIKATFDGGGRRHLKEVRLFEVSVTEIPMNDKAQVLSVKSMTGLIDAIKANRLEKKDDFASELLEIQIYAARYQMLQALSCALSSALCDVDIADRVTASKEYIQQFSDAYLAMLPDYVTLMSGGDVVEFMSNRGLEQKAGRMLSATNRGAIEDCVKALRALLDSADATEEKSIRTQPAGAAAGTPGAGAAIQLPEPVDHSAIVSKLDELKGVFQWNNSK